MLACCLLLACSIASYAYGASTGTARLTVNPKSLSFGNVKVGSSSTLPVTLTSTGTATVTVQSLTVSGKNISITGATLPLKLAPKQTATIHVHVAPKSAGAVSGAVTVSSNSVSNAAETLQVAATGTQVATPEVVASPTSLSFGSVATGSSATLPLTITSTGTGSLTISSVTVSGAEFTDSGAAFPMTLSPKKTVTLNIKFAPTAAGAASGKLMITSNAARHNSYAVALSGTGTATTSQLTVSPTSLSFGDVTVGSSASLEVTLKSTGSGAVTVNSAKISGTGFSDSGATFPVTLNPNQAVTLQVSFAPTAAGSDTGSLAITSNSSTNADPSVGLSGTAVSHQVDLSWDAPGNSPVPVAGYHIYRATGTSSTFSLLNSSLDASTSYTDTTVAASTSYSYLVKSVDSSGTESGPSNQVSVTVP